MLSLTQRLGMKNHWGRIVTTEGVAAEAPYTGLLPQFYLMLSRTQSIKSQYPVNKHLQRSRHNPDQQTAHSLARDQTVNMIMTYLWNTMSLQYLEECSVGVQRMKHWYVPDYS